MSDNPSNKRIPAEAVENASTWVIPPITDHGKILSSAEKEARERRERMLRREKETIETVEIPEPEQPAQLGMTAEEMQAIFDTAEKDGFEQGHKEGFTKGNSEGYEAGRQQGLMEMRAQLVAEQQRFQKLAQALLEPVSAQDDDIEHLLLDVICTLTQSVVQRELLTDSSHIVSLVKNAVQALPIGSKNIRVSLNPDDLAAVETYAAEQQLNWTFFGDNELLPGGCRIDTPESRVDFSVGTRLQTVLEQFITKQLASGDDSDSADENYLSSADEHAQPHNETRSDEDGRS
ncbi:MAG: flagellar assembly protein FliH [Cellvibrio sp.]|uniref:flagellar assembly protein FliH n=1 Tax=Cellvibrio sp. TaxID=1965322 RepID=UPI0031B105FC